MKTFYSASTKGFYIDIINKDIPSDAIEISDKHRKELLEEQSNGRKITVEFGKVVTKEQDPPTVKELAVAEIIRLENQITERRKREAILGTDNGWLQMQEDLITAQRTILES